MAMNDWNHNGKDDAFDHYIDYKLSGGSSGGSSGGGSGGMSILGAILCVVAGFLEPVVIYSLLHIEVEDIPIVIVIILWIVCSCLTALVVAYFHTRG